jgi:hypothetical protein
LSEGEDRQRGRKGEKESAGIVEREVSNQERLNVA